MRKHVFTTTLWSGEGVLGSLVPLPGEVWLVTFVSSLVLTVYLYWDSLGARLPWRPPPAARQRGDDFYDEIKSWIDYANYWHDPRRQRDLDDRD